MAFAILTNVSTGGIAFGPLEPTVAADQDVAFYTAAMIARFSLDAGQTWSAANIVSGANLFPQDLDGGFVQADQNAAWFENADRFVWTMLTLPDGNGQNRIRIAVTSKSVLVNSKAKGWLVMDITSAQLGFRSQWFDYPQIAVGDEFLTITANIAPKGAGRGSGGPVGTVIIFIRLTEFDSLQGHTVNFNFFAEMFKANGGINGYTAAKYGGSTVTWAMHVAGTAQQAILRVYQWDSGKNSVTWQDVKIPAWSNSGYSSLTPDGMDWLNGLDGRITGAVEIRSTEWVFAWTAAADRNFPHPYIYLAHVGRNFAKVIQLLGHREIWSKRIAWAFPALAAPDVPMRNPSLAMSCGWGGEKVEFAHHSVGFVEMPFTSTSIYDNQTSVKSAAGGQPWGDFLSVSRYKHPPDKGLVLHPARGMYAATGTVISKDAAGVVRWNPQFVIFE